MGAGHGAQSGEGTFPDTLAGFGYHFNEDGELRQIENEERFVFVVKEGDKEFNQRHYEALGEVITEHVYGLLEQTGLKRLHLPIDAEEGETQSFVFHSPDFDTNSEKLLILIHGSGVVRAGQWARRLIINDNLHSGTQLPFIRQAVRKGYAVLVLNTNLNYAPGKKGEMKKIRGNGSPEDHALYVWRHVVRDSPAKYVDIVAHSYGGRVAVHLMRHVTDARRRVRKIALTDSVHDLPVRGEDKLVRWFQKHAINWVSSGLPLDTVDEDRFGQDVERRSAGVTAHEMTSWSSFQSIFRYLDEDYASDDDGSGCTREVSGPSYEDGEEGDKLPAARAGAAEIEAIEGETSDPENRGCSSVEEVGDHPAARPDAAEPGEAIVRDTIDSENRGRSSAEELHDHTAVTTNSKYGASADEEDALTAKFV